MLVISIDLHPAVTGGPPKRIGQMVIANTGTSRNPKRGDYSVRVFKRGKTLEGNVAAGRIPLHPQSVLRRGKVLDYPRLSYNVWRLVLRALRSAIPEETR